jgi:hypothetical protein
VSQFLGVKKRRQTVQTVIGHFGYANVSLTRIGVRLLGESRFSQYAEQGRLAYLRQRNNASFHKK